MVVETYRGHLRPSLGHLGHIGRWGILGILGASWGI